LSARAFFQKAAHKLVDEIDSRCQFHQHFKSSFLGRNCFCSFPLVTAWLCIFWQKEIGAKAAWKILAKLTKGVNIVNIFTVLRFLSERAFPERIFPEKSKKHFPRKTITRK